MHRDAFATRDIANNRFAANGVAAFGAIDHDVIKAIHADDGIGLAALWLSFGGLGLRRGRRLEQFTGSGFLQYLARGELAVA